jgi:hypothetical protein
MTIVLWSVSVLTGCRCQNNHCDKMIGSADSDLKLCATVSHSELDRARFPWQATAALHSHFWRSRKWMGFWKEDVRQWERSICVLHFPKSLQTEQST